MYSVTQKVYITQFQIPAHFDRGLMIVCCHLVGASISKTSQFIDEEHFKSDFKGHSGKQSVLLFAPPSSMNNFKATLGELKYLVDSSQCRPFCPWGLNITLIMEWVWDSNLSFNSCMCRIMNVIFWMHLSKHTLEFILWSITNVS